MIGSAEQMYKDIRNWEYEAGESFGDYFEGSINEFNLLFWATGKGYITPEQLQKYENKKEHTSLDDIIYGEEEYSIVKADEEKSFDEQYEEAMKIFAEFLASTKTYQNRVDNFLNDIHLIKLTDVTREILREDGKVFIKHDGERIYINSLEDIVEVPLGKLLNTQWYLDNKND